MESARPAASDDVARILTLSAELRAELEGFRGGELWRRSQDPVSLDHASVGALLADPGSCVLVGAIDDALVGYAIVRERRLTDGTLLGEVTEIYVEPGAREVGVGEQLVTAILDWAGGRGCRGVDATALPGHRAAKNFFESFGFVARSLTMHRAVDDPAASGPSASSPPAGAPR